MGSDASLIAELSDLLLLPRAVPNARARKCASLVLQAGCYLPITVLGLSERPLTPEHAGMYDPLERCDRDSSGGSDSD